MPASDIQTVLRNWIEQATSPVGQLPESTDPAEWVGQQFVAWWREQASEELGAAFKAAHRLRTELNRVGKANELGEAMHELTHLQDALSDLERALGFQN